MRNHSKEQVRQVQPGESDGYYLLIALIAVTVALAAATLIGLTLAMTV